MMGIYTPIHLPRRAYEGKLLFVIPTCEKYVLRNLPEGRESKFTPLHSLLFKLSYNGIWALKLRSLHSNAVCALSTVNPGW